MTDEPLALESAEAWDRWLARHHASSQGVWLQLAKKGGREPLPTYAQALDVALAWGWIDSQKRPFDDGAWLQRFSPRSARSPWSKINRDKATKLIDAGKMHAPGLSEVERAKKDGRWDAAYDGARTATVPDDLAAALARNKRARAFFDALDSANRYAILWRVQTAKRPETRARRISEFVAMLARHLKRPAQGDVWVQILNSEEETRLSILEEKPMETGMVTIDASAMAKGIDADGHIAVYGIVFDTGKADLKPESEKQLAEIEKLLKSRPSLKIHVVGHTGNVGQLSANMDLSKRRADSVVKALTRRGIAASRLNAAGVGSLVPVATNDTEQGRARNRRVDLVKQ